MSRAGLTDFFNEVLSFDGNDFHITKGISQELVGEEFVTTYDRLDGGIPVGVYCNKRDQVRLLTDDHYVLRRDDDIIVFTLDANSIRWAFFSQLVVDKCMTEVVSTQLACAA